jgi:hypothetical protein
MYTHIQVQKYACATTNHCMNTLLAYASNINAPTSTCKKKTPTYIHTHTFYKKNTPTGIPRARLGTLRTGQLRTINRHFRHNSNNNDAVSRLHAPRILLRRCSNLRKPSHAATKTKAATRTPRESRHVPLPRHERIRRSAQRKSRKNEPIKAIMV